VWNGVGEGSVLGPQLYTLGQICAFMLVKIMYEISMEEQNTSTNTQSWKYADEVTGCFADELQEAVTMLKVFLFHHHIEIHYMYRSDLQTLKTN